MNIFQEAIMILQAIVILCFYDVKAWLTPSPPTTSVLLGRTRPQRSNSNTYPLYMNNFFDRISSFLDNREGDFIKLDKSSSDSYGPGPVLLLYKAPEGIADDELYDMVDDGAPIASKRGVKIRRVDDEGDHELLCDLSVEEALVQVLKENESSSNKKSDKIMRSTAEMITPVLYFSGFRNDEIISTFRIISTEISAEMGGMVRPPACAKAVPPAMNKTLRQVIDEVTGDHQDAFDMNTTRKSL